MSVDSQPKNDLMRMRATWVFALLSSSLAGISINVISNDAGYKWTAIGWAVYGVLFGAWRLRQADARIPAVRWFVLVCAVAAGFAGIAALITFPAWRPYQIIAAIVLGAAAVIAASMKDAGIMTVGMLLVGGGIAFIGEGITGSGSVFATSARLGFGVSATVIGGLMLWGRIRASGAAMIVTGVLSLTVALVFLTVGGSAFFFAIVFGSVGFGEILIGTALVGQHRSLDEVAVASIRPIASALALQYLSLGVIAILDHRVVLAVADSIPALLVAVAVVLPSIGDAVGMGWAICLLGAPMVVDGLDTATHGQMLSGTVSIVSGLVMLSLLAYRFRSTAAAVWRYAFTVPSTSSDETSKPASRR